MEHIVDKKNKKKNKKRGKKVWELKIMAEC